MNLQEFAALEAGDQIENPMFSSGVVGGTVVEATDSGVRVVWGERRELETRFFYSVNTTAWMHWTKADAQKCQAAPMESREGWLKCEPCGSVWLQTESSKKPARCVAHGS